MKITVSVLIAALFRVLIAYASANESGGDPRTPSPGKVDVDAVVLGEQKPIMLREFLQRTGIVPVWSKKNDADALLGEETSFGGSRSRHYSVKDEKVKSLFLKGTPGKGEDRSNYKLNRILVEFDTFYEVFQWHDDRKRYVKEERIKKEE